MSKSKFSDTISVFILCVQDSTVLLTQETSSNEYYVPSVVVNSSLSWLQQLNKMIEDILSIKVESKKLLRQYRIWTSLDFLPYIHHSVYFCTVDTNTKKRSKTAYGNNKIRWISDDELTKLWTSSMLKSAELLEYWMITIGGTFEATHIQPFQATIKENFLEINEKVCLRDKTSDNYAGFLEQCKFTNDHQENLYKLFLDITFPAIYMNLSGFSKVMNFCNLPNDNLNQLFRAADINNRYCLTFKELLHFIAAIDLKISHDGEAKQIRENYIFRYFDNDNDGVWNNVEFVNFINHLRSHKVSGKNQLMEFYKKMNKNENSLVITLKEFITFSTNGLFDGISDILRTPKPIANILKDPYFRDLGKDVRKRSSKKLPSVDMSENIDNSRPTAYEIGIHSIRVLKARQAIHIDDIYQISNATSNMTFKPIDDEKGRKISADIFDQHSLTNELLKSLRYLIALNTTQQAGKKTSYLWGNIASSTFCKFFINACQQAIEFFKNEPRLLELTSPLYVLGDLHGNIEDLLCFEKLLWPIGPSMCPCSLLFLGDYVDRGMYSVEVIAYLLGYKLQSPNKIYLVRGNHEVREIQRMFTFYNECINKFGEKLGKELWESINNVFDHLPIAAVIDKTIFCCHGGVPPPWLCPVLKQINNIPIPLPLPEKQSPLAWDLMWNDPIQQKIVGAKLTMELTANEGFAVNSRRGTGHVFNSEAFEKFLKYHHLSHFIRAHEVAQSGVFLGQHGKLITLFSSSKYCGGDNQAACVFADRGKMRILRIDND